MQVHIRWKRIRETILSPRVQVALMSLSMLAAAIAGTAAKRW